MTVDHAAAGGPPMGPAVIDAENPWPGLAAFDEASERFFNGRREEKAELRRLVLQTPLTVVFGASGLGKTSLLQAGLFPAIRQEHLLPIYVRLDVGDRTAPLISQATRALTTQLSVQQVEAPPLAFHDESLWEWLHREDVELWSARNQLLTPLFVFDQFEELFTIGAANAGAIDRFRLDLADLVENRIPLSVTGRIAGGEAVEARLSVSSQRYKVLIAFREDFLPAVEGWKTDLPSLMRNRLRLTPMSGRQALEAVHTTAPHLADAALARQIVRFVAAARDSGPPEKGQAADALDDLAVEPALLSLVCHGLNERRKAQRKPAFDIALLEATGPSIIGDFYRHAVDGLPPRVPRFIEQELITERGFRKTCDVDDAVAVHGVTAAELGLLVQRRLLRMESHRATERVELTHDLLTAVVREHRDQQRELARVRKARQRVALLGAIGVGLAFLAVVLAVLYRNAAQQRNEADRQKALTEAALGEVKSALKQVEDSNKSEKAQRTIAQVERDRAEAAAVTADDARQNAEQTAMIAVAGALATAALLNKETRPDLSALLAVEALNRADNFQSRNALLSTLQANPSLLTHLHATDKVGTVAFSPDGRRLAAGDNRGVTLWDVGAGRSEGATFATKEEGYIQTMAFNPDGTTLALATADHAVRFWDVRRRQFIGDPITDRTAAFRSLAFSADGSVLVTVSELGVSEWTVANQTLRRQAIDFSRPENYVLLCRISPDGRMMASGHEDGTIRLWDVATGKPDGDPLRGQSNVFALAFSGDGKRLASGHSDHTVRVWDLVTRRALGPALAGHSREVMRIAFSPKGDTVASAGLDGIIRRWDVASQRLVGEPLQSHGSVRALTFSADGETLASTDDEAGVHLWEVRNRRGLGQRLNASSEGILYALAVSPDETRMVTASTAEDRNSLESTTTVRLWNLLTRQPVGAPLSRGNDLVASAAFSPDSKMFALASDNIELFDVSTQQRVGDLSSTADGQALSVAFSRDGKMLAAGFEEGQVQLWTMPGRRAIGDPVTGREYGGTVRTVAFTPDGRILGFAGTDGLVRLWDVRRRTLLSELKGDTGAVLGLAFSPDGRVLASTSGDRAIRLWDIVAGRPIAEAMNAPTRSSARFGTVAFTKDGRMLASTVAEGAVRLWDAGTGQPVGEPLRGHTADVMRAAFASGGRTLLSAGTDGAIWAWDVSVESWRARACRMANRDLSLTEWRQYVGNDVPYRRTCFTPTTVSHSRH